MGTCIALLSLAMLLAGYSPGLVLHLYNETEDALTITNPPFHKVITIQPHTAADAGAIGGNVLIRTSQNSWFYPQQKSAFPPTSFYQQHTMLWRAFGRIDSRGRIYLLSPPRDGKAPHEIVQPSGFPLRPQSRPNKSLQATAQTASFLRMRNLVRTFMKPADCALLSRA
jgi:hypothetical protein